MKNRFILLIDFSEYSRNLIRYAFEWSDKEEAEILLVHHAAAALPSFTDENTRIEINRVENESLMMQMKSLAAEILPAPANLSYAIINTSLTEYLNEIIKLPYNNLIFLGIKGTGPLKKFFIGSVAINVIEQVNSLIVAIPKSIFEFHHNTLFVAVNHKSRFNDEKFNDLLSTTGRHIAQIFFFSVADTDDKNETVEYLRDLYNLYCHHYNTRYHVYESDRILEALKDVFRNADNPLLVVQKNSELLTDTFFRKYIINELIYEGNTPMVVLPLII